MSDWVVPTIIAGTSAGILTAVGLAILWGAWCYWSQEARRYWVMVRPRRW